MLSKYCGNARTKLNLKRRSTCGFDRSYWYYLTNESLDAWSECRGYWNTSCNHLRNWKHNFLDSQRGPGFFHQTQCPERSSMVVEQFLSSGDITVCILVLLFKLVFQNLFSKFYDSRPAAFFETRNSRIFRTNLTWGLGVERPRERAGRSLEAAGFGRPRNRLRRAVRWTWLGCDECWILI